MHPAMEHAVWSSPTDRSAWRELAKAQMEEQLGLFGSDERLEVALIILRHAPADVFWPVFLSAWPSCDDTHAQQPILLKELRRRSAVSSQYLGANELRFLQSLPERVPIFRGASRARVRGLSWTTERKVAEGFARGHRGIAVPDAVVATAVVPKAAIFAAFTDREESEVLVDPRRLCSLLVAP